MWPLLGRIPPRTGSRKWPASWKDTPANRQPEVAIWPLLARRKMAQRKRLEPVQLPPLGLPGTAPKRGPPRGPDVAASWKDTPANRQPGLASFGGLLNRIPPQTGSRSWRTTWGPWTPFSAHGRTARKKPHPDLYTNEATQRDDTSHGGPHRSLHTHPRPDCAIRAAPCNSTVTSGWSWPKMAPPGPSATPQARGPRGAPK